MSSGGPGSGLFKSTDGGETWTEITRNAGMPAGMVGRIGIADHRRRLEPRLRARRERERRPVRVGRCGRDLEADERGAQRPPARVLLHARLRRPEQQGRRLHAEHERCSARPTAARRSTQHRPEHARRPPRPVGRSRQLRSTSSTATTAAARSPTTSSSRVPNVERAGLPDRAVLSRDHDRAPALPRLRRAAGQQHAVRAEQHQRAAAAASAAIRRWRPTRPAAASPATSRRIATDPDVFFAGANNGSFLTRLNRRTGELKEVGAYPRFFSGEPSKDVKERWQWTYPIIFSLRRSERALHELAARLEDRPTAATRGRRSAAT